MFLQRKIGDARAIGLNHRIFHDEKGLSVGFFRGLQGGVDFFCAMNRKRLQYDPQ
jgi:hypothetical protein